MHADPEGSGASGLQADCKRSSKGLNPYVETRCGQRLACSGMISVPTYDDRGDAGPIRWDSGDWPKWTKAQVRSLKR
jgi:hypothetical protein